MDIPDRTFVDDLGRRWEWCGGQPGTWAWRVTDQGQCQRQHLERHLPPGIQPSDENIFRYYGIRQ